MKKIIFKIILLPLSLLAACGQHPGQPAAITGTYVNQAQSAYSIASDTLVITPLNKVFTVTRKTGFRRIVNGQLQTEQYRHQTFTGLWDKNKQFLQLSPNGIILIFSGNELSVQQSIYHKLPGGRGL